MSFNKHLIHRCDIQTLTTGQSSTGAYTESVSSTQSGVLCRFMAPTGRSRSQFEPTPQIGEMVETERILILHGTAVITTEMTVTNVVKRSDGTAVDSDTWEVTQVAPRNRRSLHHKSALLKKVK